MCCVDLRWCVVGGWCEEVLCVVIVPLLGYEVNNQGSYHHDQLSSMTFSSNEDEREEIDTQ